jgi:3-hydroxyisobutyrate dehydrogenase
MLQIFVGGDAGDAERARPVLEMIGDPDEVVHVGPHGAGQVAKLLVNLQWFIHAAAAAEALTVGVRAGIDVGVLHRIFVSGPARCSFLEHEALEILGAGEYGERFPLRLVVKDLRLALELAASTDVPAELSQATAAIYERARRRLGDGAGEMGAVRLYEELTGTLLRFDAGARSG